MAPRHSNTLMVLFSGVLGAILINIFYGSPLRARIENKLFDIRTRLTPSFTAPSHVAVVEIDDAAIQAITGAPPKAEGEPPANLSYAALIKIVKATLAADPRVVTVLLPPQVFPYGDAGLQELAALAKADRRLLLGTFDLTLKKRDPEGLPAALRQVLPQLAKADVIRDFRREIVRDLRVDETGELPFVASAMAHRMNPASLAVVDAVRKGETAAIKLNYIPPASLTRVRADALLSGDGSGKILAGRGVLIGYTTYRPWNLHAHEATFVNSPWQADGADLEEGVPVVTLWAIALENIVQDMNLKATPPWLNVLQTTVVMALTLAIWRLGVGFASFLFIGGWSLVLLLHAGLFAFAYRYVPLADAVLISSLAMMSGALWRLRLEGRLRATQEAKASSEAELARVQDRFLDRFALELSEINQKIKAALEPHRALKDQGGTAATAYVRALGSSEELEDYLLGIRQFVELPAPGSKKPRLATVDLVEVTEKVLRQFESRKREQRITTEVRADGPCLALADGMLVGQILYNLVSNAIKYSPPDKTVVITLAAGPDAPKVRVKDEGPGIPPEYQERIFEKFYRVKDDQVYKLKGHGLGLYLSRYFAAEIGATISLTSTVGQGAEFVLTLKPAKGAT